MSSGFLLDHAQGLTAGQALQDGLPLLYSYRRCPYAMRARMALLRAGRGVRVHEIVLRDKPAGLLSASPKGTVPVLCLPDGRVIDESWLIMGWATAQHDDPAVARWWQQAQTPDNLALLQTNDGPFKAWLDRYKYPERFGLDESGRAQVRAEALEAVLIPLEQRLQAAPWLGGAQPCATDVAIFPFVRQFAAVLPAVFAAMPLPALQAWLAHWQGSALFDACMRKQAPNEVVLMGSGAPLA